MNFTRNLAIAVIASVFIIAGGTLVYYSNQMPHGVADPEKRISAEIIFQASFDDLEGKSQSLAQWRGKILVVNFWATWCPPCLNEIPEFIQLQKQYAKQGVQFVGIAIDKKNKVQAYAKEAGMNYPVLLGELAGADFSRQIGNKNRGLPYTVVVDRNGNIASKQLGLLSQEKLEEIIESLL